MPHTLKPALISLLILFLSLPLFATDRKFTYTYESRTLQKGLRELEVWVTHKYGREEFYSALENRLEFEIGLSQRLQTAFYLNLNASTAPFTTIIPSINSSGEFILLEQTDLRTQFKIGFSNEWKFQMSDPSANKIGSALYGEISLSPGEFELEGKIILDKKLNRFITAFNVVGELELESKLETEESGETETEWEREYVLEFDYGLAYSLNDHWALGFETRNHNEFLPDEGWEHSALFLGPNISYSSDEWWMSLTVLPQIANLKGSGLVLDEHERINSRLIFSYSF